MIRINLFPHREAERKRRRDHFRYGLVASVLGAVLAGGVLYIGQIVRVVWQQARNEQLRTELQRFDAQIRDMAGLRQQIESLRARALAVEGLQADRNLPVQVLGELARHLPEGAFLTSVRQEEAFITVAGVAQSNERVSEFLRRLGHDSPWLGQPELVEIVAGSLALGPREQRRVVNFTLRVQPQPQPMADASLPGAPALAASRPQGASPPASRPATSALAPAGTALPASRLSSRPLA